MKDDATILLRATPVARIMYLGDAAEVAERATDTLHWAIASLSAALVPSALILVALVC